MSTDTIVKVDRQGIQFGPHCWISHEKITGLSAQQLNQGAGNLAVRKYIDWVRSVIGKEDIIDPTITVTG